MANDVNKTFVSLAGLFLVGGIVAALQNGIVSFFLALLGCYIMLVATNAISRGEKRGRQ